MRGRGTARRGTHVSGRHVCVVELCNDAKLLLERLDEIEQAHRLIVAEIENLVPARAQRHRADDARHDVVNVCEVAPWLAVAVHLVRGEGGGDG